MRAFILVGTSLLAFSAALAVAEAAPVTFGYTGGLQSYTVLMTGLYDILALGGGGGNAIGVPSGKPYSYGGGSGAKIGGDFLLTAGEMLSIAVAGGGASSANGGGGGGTFVVGPGNTPLIVGGGGAIGEGELGGPAQFGTAAADGNYVQGYQGVGGSGGRGGGAPVSYGAGGGGGGFYGSGSNALTAQLGANGQLITVIAAYGGGSYPSLAGGTSSAGISGGFGRGRRRFGRGR